MSEKELESAPTETPVMDDETYQFVQEVFQRNQNIILRKAA